MTIDNALASIAVKDLKTAAAWNEKLFPRPADSNPMPEVAEWKFDRGGWLQVYQLPCRAGGGSCQVSAFQISAFSFIMILDPRCGSLSPTDF